MEKPPGSSNAETDEREGKKYEVKLFAVVDADDDDGVGDQPTVVPP